MRALLELLKLRLDSMKNLLEILPNGELDLLEINELTGRMAELIWLISYMESHGTRKMVPILHETLGEYLDD